MYFVKLFRRLTSPKESSMIYQAYVDGRYMVTQLIIAENEEKLRISPSRIISNNPRLFILRIILSGIRKIRYITDET